MPKEPTYLDFIPNPDLKLLPAGKVAKPFLNFDNEDQPTKPAHHYSSALFAVIMFSLAAVLSASFYYMMENFSVAKSAQNMAALPSVAGVSDQVLLDDASSSGSPSAATYKLEILNGSGISGKAASLKKQLTDSKFSTITTGNTDQPADQTELDLKSTVPVAVKQSILDNLKSEFPKINTTVLDKNSDFDLILTIGKVAK